MRTRKIMLLFVLCVWITGCRQVNTTTIINPEPALKATKSPTTSSSATHNLTPEQQVTPATASPDIKVKGLVKIGDHPLFINCSGSGTPTVVLEAGWNDTSDTWSEVQAAVDDFTRVCSYDRAGLGRSPAGPEPRTLDKEAAELYQLLEEAGVNGPSILVGHSYGGMLVRLFTDQHAEQVAGRVLVDSPHPDIYRRSLAVLPPESPEENESVRFYREWFTQEIEKPTMKIDPALFEPESLGDLPRVVLTALLKERPEDFPQELNDSFNQIWLDLQEELASMSTSSSHILAEKSAHFIQHDQPDLVIEANKGIFQELR